jgi:hypothetical protein
MRIKIRRNSAWPKQIRRNQAKSQRDPAWPDLFRASGSRSEQVLAGAPGTGRHGQARGSGAPWPRRGDRMRTRADSLDEAGRNEASSGAGSRGSDLTLTDEASDHGRAAAPGWDGASGGHGWIGGRGDGIGGDPIEADGEGDGAGDELRQQDKADGDAGETGRASQGTRRLTTATNGGRRQLYRREKGTSCACQKKESPRL